MLRWGSRSRWASMPAQIQRVNGGGSVGGVGTGAGCAARARSGCGFDVAGVQVPALARAVARFSAGASIRRGRGDRPGSGTRHRRWARDAECGGPVGVPMTTAREWRRRFQLRAPALAAALVAVAVHLDPAAVVLSSDGEAAALEALGAAWQRARTRFGERVPAVWRFWSLISGGQALGTNRSPPATRAFGAGWMAPSP